MYKVIDEFSGEVKFFEDLKEAKRYAFNIQGLLYHEDEFLADYSDF